MKFSVQFPVSSPGYSPSLLIPEHVTRVAQSLEASGFDALAFTEHPAPSKAWMDSGGHDSLDLTTALAYCAATTKKIRLMTYLLVVPYHSPFMAAKALTTLDILSGGRLVVVAGTGYLRAEFKALRVDMEQRNTLFDESVEVMKGLWSQSPYSHTGEHFEARDVVSLPPPVQVGGPPILIGGNGKMARTRAALHDGWSPMMASEAVAKMSRTPQLTSISTLRDQIDEIRTSAAANRPGHAPLSVQVQTPEGAVLLGSGPLDRHSEHLEELVEAGVDSFMLDLPGGSVDQTLEAIQRYSEEIIIPLNSRHEERQP